MKGIILLGGAGSRMRPITVNKHLLPIGMVPMAFHSISTLFSANIRDILLIITARDREDFQQMLGNGDRFGVNFSYKVQENPGGIAEAFLIGEDFILDDSLFLVLGDNMAYAAGLTGVLENACANVCGAHVFGRHVDDPDRYGVAVVNPDTGIVERIVEKPTEYIGDLAIIGWYLYSNGAEVCEIAKSVPRSAPPRNELEVTSVNQVFVERSRLNLTVLPFGLTWLDTGTHQAYNAACAQVMSHYAGSGSHYGSLEQIALHKGWIDEDDMEKAIKSYGQSQYAEYLTKVLEAKHRNQKIFH